MLPQQPDSAREAAMATLKGMKFMMRKEEARRVEDLQKQRTQKQFTAPSSISREMSNGSEVRIRVIAAASLPPNTASMRAGRIQYGAVELEQKMLLVEQPAANAGTASEPQEAPRVHASPKGTGNRGKRVYLAEGDRAPPLPRRLEQLVDGPNNGRVGPKRRKQPRSRAEDLSSSPNVSEDD